MSAGSRQALASRTLRYTGLKLAEFGGGRARCAPFKEFRQPYFGSLQQGQYHTCLRNPASSFFPSLRLSFVGAGLVYSELRRARLPGLHEQSENCLSNLSKFHSPPATPDRSPHPNTRSPPHPN